VASVLVDRNILIDIIVIAARWFEWSARAFGEAAEKNRLVITPIIYS
jgi:hypothetical protein